MQELLLKMGGGRLRGGGGGGGGGRIRGILRYTHKVSCALLTAKSGLRS